MVSQSTFTVYFTQANCPSRMTLVLILQLLHDFQNQSSPQISNELSFHASITEDFSTILNKPRCAPPGLNTPSAIINLSAPTPPPGTTSSHITDEVPELLVNKVFPAYMRHAICFQCQRTSHYKSFCPYYHCTNCK
jgi:hypothetical protein